uniref:Doublecortin domain-containing protein n=1 Tax=Caenorhabditis japonica TaxID=281687 RepID=A0A8R1HUK5_CAEJA
MPTPSTIKKKATSSKKIIEDPLSSSGVSSLSGISSFNIRKISIYKNGDRFHRGVKFVINPRVVKNMEPLLNQINDRIELSHGAKKLYTADGKVVNSIKELEDGKIYVAASAHFIPMRYGEFTERVWKPPSRKHSPIMSADRIKTARTRSQEPGKRRQKSQEKNPTATVQRSRSVRTLTEDHRSRKEANGAAKKPDIPAPRPRPKAPTKPPVSRISKPPPRPSAPTTSKKPPTPKRNKKVLAAAMGAGVAVVGAAALGAAKKSTPKTAMSTASSVIPAPNVESNAAEILEFPEEIRKVDMATIHRTPTPSESPVVVRVESAKSTKSVKSVKSMAPSAASAVSGASAASATGTAAEAAADRAARMLAARSISQQPTPESSEVSDEDGEYEEYYDEEEEEEEEEEASEGESEAGEESEEVEEPSDEEEDEEESGVVTPASKRSSAAPSPNKDHAEDEKDEKKE